MSHISRVNSSEQINQIPLEAESAEAQLIRRVRDTIGIEIDHDMIDLYGRESHEQSDIDYEARMSILESSGDESQLVAERNKVLIATVLKAFEGDLQSLVMLVNYYIESDFRDFSKAMTFFKIAMEHHTWNSEQSCMIDEILITVIEILFDKAETPEEISYLPHVEEVLIDYAQRFPDVKYKLAQLYLSRQGEAQNLDRVLEYFQDLWSLDLKNDYASDNEYAVKNLLREIFNLAKRGNEKSQRFLSDFETQEMRPERRALFEELKSQFNDPRFDDIEALDQNVDYLKLIGNYKSLKKLARAGDPKASLYMAIVTYDDEDKKNAYLLTAIEGGEFEALDMLDSENIPSKYDLDSYGRFCAGISRLLLTSLDSLDKGDPKGLFDLHKILDKVPSLDLHDLNIEPRDLERITTACSRIMTAARNGDIGAFVQFYHYSKQINNRYLPDVMSCFALCNVKLADQGDISALSSFLELIDKCEGIAYDATYYVSVRAIIAGLKASLGPLVVTGERSFNDLLTMIQWLDEKSQSSQDLKDLCLRFAQVNNAFYLNLGVFYGCETKSQNLELAKEYLEAFLGSSTHENAVESGLVDFYLERSSEIRGPEAHYFLGNYYLDLGEIDLARQYLIEAWKIKEPHEGSYIPHQKFEALCPLIAYYLDEEHQDLETAKNLIKMTLQVFSESPVSMRKSGIYNAFMQIPGAWEQIEQLIAEEHLDALFFVGTYDHQLNREIRAEHLKRAAILGHPYAFPQLMLNFRGDKGEIRIAEVLYHRNPGDPMIVDYLKYGLLAFDQRAIDLLLKLSPEVINYNNPEVNNDHYLGCFMMGLLQIRDGNLQEGIELLTEAALNLNYTASVILGEAFAVGHFDLNGQIVDIEENRELADTYLNSIIGNYSVDGDLRARAHFSLGLMAYTEEESIRDFQVAFYYFTLASKLGSSKGEYYLGLCYIEGNGVVTDPVEGYRHIQNAAYNGCEEAIDWLFARANNDGDLMSQLDLGEIFKARGEYEDAIFCFQKAADQGHTSALYSIAEIHKDANNMDKAMAFYEAAADKYYSPAMEIVANYYYEHEDETVQNYHKAYLQYRFLSQNPDMPPEYSFRLGYILFHGLGHVFNGRSFYTQALKAFKRAAKKAHADARFMVGKMYNEGLGTERNVNKARIHLKSAVFSQWAADYLDEMRASQPAKGDSFAAPA